MIKTKNIEKLMLGLCLLLVSCSTKEYVDNQSMIKRIDLLEFSKVIVEIELDSLGNIADTVSISKYKYDSNGVKRYLEKVFSLADRQMTIIDYYQEEEDLFYRMVRNNEDEVDLIYETKSIVGGNIVAANQVAMDGEKVDSTTMIYDYEYHSNGNRKMLQVKAISQNVGKLQTRIIYNIDEQPTLETMTMNEDTLALQSWEYENDLLSKVINFNYQMDTAKTVYKYGEGERLITDILFQLQQGVFVKTVETKYQYDETDELVAMEKKNLSTGTVTRYKYLKEEL